MPQKTAPRPATGNAPPRSDTAGPVHTAEDVQWTIDLTQSPERLVARAHSAIRDSVIGLSLLAAAVWSYDVSRFVGH